MVKTTTTLRGQRFATLVADELKTTIINSTHSIRSVAAAIGIEQATLSRYLNGHRDLPIAVFLDACETIATDPRTVMDRAYTRLLTELGHP